MRPPFRSIGQARLWRKEVRLGPETRPTPPDRPPAIAAWEFVETHKGEINWDVVAMNPPLVRNFVPARNLANRPINRYASLLGLGRKQNSFELHMAHVS